jgi:nucleoside-diphosphate-sugar epimerase
LDAELIKVGITGSGGFIGGNLASQLVAKGYSVRAFTSNRRNHDLVYLDWKHEKQVEAEFKDLDVLIHCAWLGSDRQSRLNAEVQKKNLLVADRIVKIQKHVGIPKIIGVGSQDELIDGDQPWTDNAKISPSSEYAKAKYQTLNIFKENIENFTWARLFSVYGKNDKRDWIINNAVKAIKNNVGITFGECSKPWSLTHVNDISTAFETILNKSLTGVVNISDLNAPSLRNHLELMQSLAKKELFGFKSNNVNQREISIASGILDIAGWKASVSREEGFLELLK